MSGPRAGTLSVISPVYRNADTLEALSQQVLSFAEPLFEAVEVMVGAASPIDEAVSAHLEDV